MKSTLSITLILLCMLVFSAHKGKEFPSYEGQTCPPDMVFVKGNDSIPSFFVSRSQETNMNYVLYLDWLEHVFVDYPQTKQDAMPHIQEATALHHFNDPLRQYNIYHPALAYYPVVGVSWLQTQRYMEWKTDRINEYILYSIEGGKKYQEGRRNIIDENNFNTEAYLSGQYARPGTTFNYDGIDYANMGKHALSKTKPYFFTGLRLPTEEEYDYAAQQAVNTIDFGASDHPYGKPFYLSFFASSQEKNKYTAIQDYLSYIKPEEPANTERIKGAGAYNHDNYGIFNMGNNVKEWLFDEYGSRKKHYSSVPDIFWQNGYQEQDSISFIDCYGDLLDKDSLGRLRFNIMGIRAGGQDLRIARYKQAVYQCNMLINPDSLKTLEAAAKLNVEYYYHSKHGSPRNTPRYSLNQFYESREYDSVYRIKYAELKALGDYRYKHDWHFISWDSTKRYRVVKSGTWKNPSLTAREKMKETDYSNEVGFRTVIQYYGLPIDRKYRVKWR